MVLIGEKIQSLRKAKHITQSDLANAVGVTTQAVSKWECGGTPDAEILPLIADYFRVSMDYLFGREHEEKQDLSAYIFSQIKRLSKEQRNMESLRIMLALFNACSDIDEIEAIYKSGNMKLMEDEDLRFGYQMATDDTFAIMSLMSSSPYAIFMPEPIQGYFTTLLSAEEYRAFFEFLSKPYCMEVILQIYQRTNGFTIPKLSLLLGLEEKIILPIITEMVEKTWLVTLDIDTDVNTIPVYVMDGSIVILPFLLTSREVCQKINVGYALIKREKPILYQNEQKNETKTKAV